MIYQLRRKKFNMIYKMKNILYFHYFLLFFSFFPKDIIFCHYIYIYTKISFLKLHYYHILLFLKEDFYVIHECSNI